MEYRYNPGDAVLIIKELSDSWGKYYMRSGPNANTQWQPATGDMCSLKGRVVHIKEQTTIGTYKVEEDPNNWNWTDEMFDCSVDKGQCFCESLL